MASRKLTLEEACRLIKENDPTLTNLDLSDTKVGDVGAVALAFALKKNNFITELYLMNAAVGPTGAIKLAGALKVNYTLERLYLQSNTIGDKGAEALASALKENVSLRLLNLSRNEIGDIGVASLAEGLMENEALHKLYLYNNNIGNIGADALAEVVKENTTLQELFLWENKIRDEGLETLRRAYESVVTDGRRLQLKTHWKLNEISSGSLVSKPAPKRAAPRAQISQSDPENSNKEKAAGGEKTAEEKKNDFKSKTSFLVKEQPKPMAQIKSPVREDSKSKLQQTNKEEMTEDQEAPVEESNFKLLTRALACKVEVSEEQSKAMAQKKSKGGQGSVPENGVNAKSKALATMFDKRKEEPKQSPSGQNGVMAKSKALATMFDKVIEGAKSSGQSPKQSPSEQNKTSPKKNSRSVLPRAAALPSQVPFPDSSTGDLHPENKMEAVEENVNNFKALTSALASKVDKVKEQSRPMAQNKSKGGAEAAADDSVKAKSKALATMFGRPTEQLRSLSQTTLETKASRIVSPRRASTSSRTLLPESGAAAMQRRASTSSRIRVPESRAGKLQPVNTENATENKDVVQGNKNGVKERAKALALLEKAKEETKSMAHISLSPAGSATGAKQKSQALAKMLVQREVHPTDLVQSQSRSQNHLDLETSEEQEDAVAENKNGVKERAKALALLEKAKEESKSMAHCISLSPAGFSKPRSQALAKMLVQRGVRPTGLVQDKSQNSLRSEEASEEVQDVVEENKNGVKERAKALALLEKAKEESKSMVHSISLSPAGFSKPRSQALAKMLVQRGVHPTGLVQDKPQNSLRSEGASEEIQHVVEANRNGVKERAKALTLLEKAKEESKSMTHSTSLSPAGVSTGAKQKSQALAKMLVQRGVHPTGLVQDKSQNSLRSGGASEEIQDVVETNKKGVKERAKALTLLENAKEESKSFAHSISLSPAGSTTGAKQKSQALARMLVQREVHPTGLVHSKSQNRLDSDASRGQDVVEENKNGVKERAMALTKVEKAKEESKSVAHNKSQTPDVGASEKQDVVEGNKNGVKERAKALTLLEEAKEQAKLSSRSQRRSSLWS